MQKYIPDLITDIPVEQITEAELTRIKDNLIQPFSLNGEALCRFRIFITEKAKYLFWDDHHIVCDGIGKAAFMHDLQKVYDGQEITCDSWFTYLQERENAKATPHYIDSKKLYEDFYGHHNFCGYPYTDFPESERSTQGILCVNSAVNYSSLEILKRFHLTRTEFFTAIALLAVAEYNHNPDVLITWCNKGRWKKEHHRITGMMIQDMPVFVSVKGLALSDVFASVRQQAKGCMLHRDYPYAVIDAKMLRDENLCVIYQGRIYSDGPDIPLSAGLEDMQNKYSGAENILDVEVIESESGIDLRFIYAAHRYKHESIERFSKLYVQILNDAFIEVEADA